MPAIGEQKVVARGELSEDQILHLDGILEYHGVEKSSPHSTPERLAYACLGCGSIGECKSREDRDAFVDGQDVQCCGLTVMFHSDHRVLVDISTLVIVHQVTDPLESVQLAERKEAARLAAIVWDEGHGTLEYTGVTQFTNDDGDEVPDSLEATQWFQMKDAGDNILWIRSDDDKFHLLSDEEYNG